MSLFATDLAGQPSLSPGFEHPLGLMTRCLLPVDVYCFVFSFWSVLSAEMTVFSLLYVYNFYLLLLFLYFLIYYIYFIYTLKCFSLFARGRLMCNKPHLYCFCTAV
jgi:hypothetical protein